MSTAIEDDELENLLEEHQLDIVEIIRTTHAMLDEEDDPERVEYLRQIQDYADAYLQTFETDKHLYRE